MPLTNDELQRAITETARASVLASSADSISLSQHLQRLLATQAKRVHENEKPTVGTAQRYDLAPFQFSRGQALEEDVQNAYALLRRCGFKNVRIVADRFRAVSGGVRRC